jgi:predicted TIM-barrel fold metal-dependent hydrolase
MISFVSFFWQGVWDTFPNLRMGFLEGGCGWLAAVLDRMEREAHYRLRANRIKTREYLESGKILIGCEGGEETLGYLVKRVGPRPFAMATDYPHEVDMVSAIEEIQDLSNYPGLSIDERAAILGNNARQFFKL